MRVSGLKQDLNMWREVRRATGVKPGGSVLRGRTYAPRSAEMEARAESEAGVACRCLPSNVARLW